MSEREIRIVPTETTVRERLNHLKSLPRKGFGPSWSDWSQTYHRDEEWVLTTIAAVGLPVENIASLHRRENTREKPNTLGSWWESKREFSLYKLLGDIPPIAQMGTIAHELGHVSSPEITENRKFYGSNEARLQALDHAIDISSQTIDTKVFLNGYHKHLFNQMQQNRISPEHYAEETHAIMIELRFSNPKHLAEVQNAQKEALRRAGREDEFVAIFSLDEDQAVGVDKTLLSLMPQFHGDIRALRTHIQTLHEAMLQDQKNNPNVMTLPQQPRIRRAA